MHEIVQQQRLIQEACTIVHCTWLTHDYLNTSCGTILCEEYKLPAWTIRSRQALDLVTERGSSRVWCQSVSDITLAMARREEGGKREDGGMREKGDRGRNARC